MCDDASMTSTVTYTHETFIHEIRDIAVTAAEQAGTISDVEAHQLRTAKLVYGVGQRVGLRGACYHGVWHGHDGEPADLIEICSLGQESHVQLAATTIHELAHVVTFGDGHGKVWKEATMRLGFARKLKVGQQYRLADFGPALRHAIAALVARLGDGRPDWMLVDPALVPSRRTKRVCSAGVGVRGGKSQGKGSGSRLRLYECSCREHDGRPGPWKVRVASDNFQAVCSDCGFPFMKQG